MTASASAPPPGSGIGMAATPAADPSGLGGAIGVSVTEAALPSQVNGGLKQLDPSTGSMKQVPETGKRGFWILSEGRRYRIPLTDAQQKKYEELEKELLKGSSPEETAKATLNFTRGWLEIDGRIIKYLNEDPNSDSAKQLCEMRMLYHDALGQSYSDVLWHEYAPGDRASTKDPNPFQQMKTFDPDKKLKFPDDKLTKPQLREFHFAKKLQKGISDLLEKQSDQVKPSTTADSRKKQIGRLKDQYDNLNELVMRYYAAHPVPVFSDKTTGQEKFDAIQKYRDEAVAFLEPLVKTLDSWVPGAIKKKHSDDPEVQKALKAFALEIALSACTTRREYDQMCTVFRTFENTETHPCKTTPELFIMRLSHAAAMGEDVSGFIEDNFDLAFGGLTHQEDRDDILAGVAALVVKTNEALDDAKLVALANGGAKDAVTAYNTRVEQLDIVKKQNTITKALRDVVKDLGGKRADLAATASRLERVAGRLDRDVEKPLEEAHSKREEFKPFADVILGKPGKASRDTAGAIVTDLAEQVKALEEQADQTNLRPIINRLKAIIQDETALGEYIAEISGDSPALQRWGNKLNPWHKARELGPIATSLGG